MSCSVLTAGCTYQGATLEDPGIYIYDVASVAVDTTLATVVYQWVRHGDSSPSIDLDETDTEVNRGVGTDANGVTFSLGAALMALTPGTYDVWYTVTVSGDVYRSRRIVTVERHS